MSVEVAANSPEPTTKDMSADTETPVLENNVEGQHAEENSVDEQGEGSESVTKKGESGEGETDVSGETTAQDADDTKEGEEEGTGEGEQQTVEVETQEGQPSETSEHQDFEDDDDDDSDDSDEDYEDYDDPEVQYIDDEDDGDADLTNKLNELRGMMGNFYPFGTQNQYSSVDLVLSKKDFELEELLELDDFLPDLRRGKNNLLSYLVQPDVLEQLISYISSEPKPADEEDEAEAEKMKRFAHLAYETIQSDVIKEAMINDHRLLDKFFDFLDITTEMDPLRCAYFSRIVELLFERYPKELVAYLRKKNCIVAKFVWHINNQYIVESLFRLIDSQISHQWLHDEDLIPLLMFKMAECEDPETQEKTAATFVEILDLFVPFPYSILTTQMFHSEIVAEQWEQFTLSEPTNYDKIQNGLNVAIGILNLSYEGNMTDETPIFMQTVVSRLDFFLELLKNPRDPARSFDMTYGKLTPPFGFLRIKILEFLCALLNTRYQSVVDALWKSEPNVFNTLLDIFFFYKWNNTLHYYVDQIIATIMSLDNGENIISVLIEKCKFLERFTDAFKKDTDRTAGFMGHLVHLANELIKASTYHPPLAQLLEETAAWKELVNGKLKETNTMNNTPIGGGVGGNGGMLHDQQDMLDGSGLGNAEFLYEGGQEDDSGQFEEDDGGIEFVEENADNNNNGGEQQQQEQQQQQPAAAAEESTEEPADVDADANAGADASADAGADAGAADQTDGGESAEGGEGAAADAGAAADSASD